MAKLNPTQAHEQWGISKSMLYRDMNGGDLSYTKDDSGKRFIDTSELLRKYGEPKKSITDSVGESNNVLREIIERQDKANSDHIKTLQDQIDSQRKQLETMTESIDRFTRLLEHQQTTPTPEPEKTPEPPTLEAVQVESPPQQAKRKKSFLGRILAAAIDD